MKELLGLMPRPRIVTACCGAGWGLTSALMATPGASEYLVGSYLPYDADETAAFLGFRPEKFVSEETAVHLATEAFMRASLRSASGDRPIGVGLTASIASLKERRGEHEVFVAVAGDADVDVSTIRFNRATGDDARRLNDEDASLEAGMMLDCFARGDFHLARANDAAKLAFLSRPLFGPAQRQKELPRDAILFPGAFNPLHEGHKRIADAVFRQTGCPVVYAITADSPHKPALTFQEMARRAALIRQEGAVLFSEGDPLYIDKARRHPGHAFIIGADALERMLDPKWGPAIEPMLDEFQVLNARLLVAPRIVNGRVLEMAEALAVAGVAPRLIGRLFGSVNIAPTDVSSTQLREGATV